MGAVRHLKLAAILGFILLTAGQLALHHHSLIPEAGQPALVCGVCAFSADQTTADIPIARPHVVAWLVDTDETSTVTAGPPALLPSRAPPAAA
jgi:hypothetical protein